MEDIRKALGHPELTSRQQRLLAALLTYMPFDDGGWTLSTGRMARDLYGDDNRTARKNTSTVLRELRHLGFVTTEQRTSHYDRQGSNRIFVETWRLYENDVTVTTSDFTAKSGDVTAKSVDVTLNSSDFTVGGPISTSHIHVPPSSESLEEPAHQELLELDATSNDARELDELPPPSAPSSPPLERAPGSEGRGPSRAQDGFTGDCPGSEGRLETTNKLEEPAWSVWADMLVFRIDWEGTPEAEELTDLYAKFRACDRRLAQQTTEAIAREHHDDPRRAASVLRDCLA